jgi:hypothetical protein
MSCVSVLVRRYGHKEMDVLLSLYLSRVVGCCYYDHDPNSGQDLFLKYTHSLDFSGQSSS